ncbi:MAG: GNAT family N-acetyltransferase [Bacteroidota bacterium]
MIYQHYTHTTIKDFTIHTDPSLLNVRFIHQFLSEESYWSEGVEKKDTKELLEDELCFGVFHKKEQIGFASVTSDFSSYAYISDVFIDKKFERQGLATWLLQCILSHPRLKLLPEWMLLTDDAHELYEKIGFKRIAGSADQMIKYNKKGA